MNQRILFVGDRLDLMAHYGNALGSRFHVAIAEGAEDGLAKCLIPDSFAVVVADQQMTGMGGVEFLSKVHELAPDAIRILLTEAKDLEVALRIANEKNIFRLLSKPCSPEALSKTLQDALIQRHLVTAEKELLGKTLNGSIKLFTDVLSIVDGPSFGRAQRLRDLVTRATDRLQLKNAWEIRLAVMLTPIGFITVPAETLVKAHAGQVLSKTEEQMIARLPEVASRLLANIPRLEGVARIVRYQQKHFDGTGLPADLIAGEAIPLGARLVKILTDMLQLQENGRRRLDSLAEMQQRRGWYDSALLASVCKCFGGGELVAPETQRPTISVRVKDLSPGMVLRSNIETQEGTLILSAGHQLNDMALEIIQNFHRLSGLKEPIFVEDSSAQALNLPPNFSPTHIPAGASPLDGETTCSEQTTLTSK